MARPTKHTEESITAEAAKFKSRSEFAAGNQYLYNKARELGLMDKLFPVVDEVRWNESTITAEAKKYKTRTEFFNGARGAYNASVRLGLIDKLFPSANEAMRQKSFEALANIIATTYDIDGGNRHYMFNHIPNYPWQLVVWGFVMIHMGNLELDGPERELFLIDLSNRTEWMTGFRFSRPAISEIVAKYEEAKATREREKVERIKKELLLNAQLSSLPDWERIHLCGLSEEERIDYLQKKSQIV